MKKEDIDFLKTLLIKLDIKIDAHHEKVSANGLALLYNFTDKIRKEDMIKALDILDKEEK